MSLPPPFSLPSILSLLLSLLLLVNISPAQQQQQLPLPSSEQDAVFQVLDSINSAIPWRTLFPDDLCSSAPHGIVCDFFSSSDSSSQLPDTPHITELSFGFVSDFSPNPPCSSNSTLNPLLFTSFNYLRKLFLYKCFTGPTRVSFRQNDSVFPEPGFASSLEELVFIDNPSLVGTLSDMLRNFTSLRRVVLTGNGIYGHIPETVSGLVDLEELTLSGNQLTGQVPLNLGNLKKLKILDLSRNHIDGNAPVSLGYLPRLLKLDLSSNVLNGKIPDTLKNLKNLEFLDLSYNRFGNYGIPLFLSEMPGLKEMHLSGNALGGQIPEIWANSGGILGIGLSETGLVGKIPGSMGVFLRNVSYMGLDNNKLEGTVPEEFGLLEFVNEINLENNRLSGRVTIMPGIGNKLKIKGNPLLCIGHDDKKKKKKGFEGSLGNLRVCNEEENLSLAHTVNNLNLNEASSPSCSSSSSSHSMLVLLVIGGFALLLV